MDKIGLVTITYNSADVLVSFLNCVWQQTYDNFILYVIDNSSGDNSLSILKKDSDSRLVIIENPANFGVAKANNQGIFKALEDGCDQILIINNDVEFEHTLIEKLVEFQNKYACSLVAPKMMYFNTPSTIWYAGSWFVKKKGYLPLHRGMGELDKGQYNTIVQIQYSPTCCLLVRKEVFHDIGMMDEKYFVYFDDTDFSYRIWKDGRHKMFYYPNTKFYHKVCSLTKSFEQNVKKKGYLPLHRGMGELDEGQYNAIVQIQYSPTCCLLVKKEVFHDIGMMDEKYFVYFDDTDFSYRIWKDGRHKMFYYPNVEFYHKVGSLTKSFEQNAHETYRSDFFIQQNTRNQIYFLKRIGSIFAYIFI
ncbi:MAG: glycosyltransferase family 2 protein, partial [Bacteroidota bacterium]|nr:glycosyltransferase family 2 protein [Bacteroidota bacterium]